MRNFVKIYKRLDRIHRQIKLQRTGNAEELAAKLAVSERSIHHYFNILRTFGYNIYYSYWRKSYIYDETPVIRNISETKNKEVAV